MGKEAATPSRTWQLLSSARPEMVLFLAVTARQQAVSQKIKNFFTKWRQVQQKVPLPEMTELRITPQMPEYPKIANDVFMLLLDGKLRSKTETLKYLKPLSPPPPPPPPAPVKRGRVKGAVAAADKGKVKGKGKDKDQARRLCLALVRSLKVRPERLLQLSRLLSKPTGAVASAPATAAKTSAAPAKPPAPVKVPVPVKAKPEKATPAKMPAAKPAKKAVKPAPKPTKKIAPRKAASKKSAPKAKGKKK